MKRLFKTAIAYSLFAGLSACGGGGGATTGGGTGNNPSAPAATTVAALVSSAQSYPASEGAKLLGVQANVRGFPELTNLELRETLGAVNSSVLRMNDGSVFFEGDFASANLNAKPTIVQSVSDPSEFRTINFTDSSYNSDFITGFDNQSVVYLGVTGPAISAQMPTSGQATYQGEARGDLSILDDKVYNYSQGTSIVSADFTAGTVDAVLSNFNATLGAPVDEVRITGMSISGERFDGSGVQLLNKGSTVSALGRNTTSVGSGFFGGGSDASGVPNEAAGMIYAVGGKGAVVMGFVSQ